MGGFSVEHKGKGAFEAMGKLGRGPNGILSAMPL